MPAWSQDARWTGAASSDWDSNGNWSPAVVPTGTAVFGASARTSVGFSQIDTSVGTIQFDPTAPAYTYTLSCVSLPGCVLQPQTLTLTGAGIINNAATIPSFVIATRTKLTVQAGTAANANFLMSGGGGQLSF